ncbi:MULTISPECIES: acylphosphatase [Methanosarcina]|uniref:acylphosphatase n=1 Tax=Methanosarcina vacuolata Z-761 TaxID=1434123 RepID=A0A0E3Q5Z1_9EURY|nr:MULTISPECIES: acylphosphatase [Methanosarcina]AKB43904.1 Acylphosphatase [Methanosarcina vacuolata Z-761]AKB47342.1 Acylphosphatase [Methanosarcina sp. Kolksee]
MTSGETVRAEILVSGRVQGVGFRRFARNAAERLGVESNPKNLRDGRVFVIAEGRPESVELYIAELRKGPMFAHVEDVDVTFKEALGNVYQAF